MSHSPESMKCLDDVGWEIAGGNAGEPPLSADFGEPGMWGGFVLSLFAWINADCLFRALICCCLAGKQASWKGATSSLCREEKRGDQTGQEGQRGRAGEGPALGE